MTGQGSNQSVASRMTKIESQLECPVCFNIPRDLPVPSCPSGHIVCIPCKKRVLDCPTCRQPLPENSTNSVVGALIEQVHHKCKYSDQGCELKMMLKDLVTHEKQCPDRTFKCPYSGCTQFVNLKNFDHHAFEGKYHSYHSLKIDGNSIWFEILKNNVACQSWPMVCIKALNELFHVNFAYHKPSKCFVLSIWLAKSQNIACKYRANLKIEGDLRKLCFDGIKVSSVENVPSIEKCIEEIGNLSLCLPMNLAKNISTTEAGIKEKLTVEVCFKKI